MSSDFEFQFYLRCFTPDGGLAAESLIKSPYVLARRGDVVEVEGVRFVVGEIVWKLEPDRTTIVAVATQEGQP